jgi:hypothetical protein
MPKLTFQPTTVTSPPWTEVPSPALGAGDLHD